MFNFKRAKTKAIKNLKRHYVIFVISCLLAAYLGSAYGSTLSAYQYTIGGNDDIVESGKSVSGKLTADSVFNKLTEGQAFDGKIISDSLLRKEEGSGAKYGILEIGRSKGVLSSIVNGLNSGQFLIIAFNTINSVVHSNSVSGTIMIIISSALMMAITIFLKDTYAVTLRRIFMEGRVYDRIGSSTFIYLLKTKKLIKASTTIFVTGVFQFLWNFTIIGGAVKRYSYAMVPYIVADGAPNRSNTNAHKCANILVLSGVVSTTAPDFSIKSNSALVGPCPLVNTNNVALWSINACMRSRRTRRSSECMYAISALPISCRRFHAKCT